MRAILIDSEGAAPRLVEDADESLLTGEVALDVEFSSLNYKDAMALAGKGIAREASLVLSCRRAAELAPGWDSVWQAAQDSRAVSA